MRRNKESLTAIIFITTPIVGVSIYLICTEAIWLIFNFYDNRIKYKKNGNQIFLETNIDLQKNNT